jgi:uncharacterized protein YcaQ
MPLNKLPPPQITFTLPHARRFLLLHQRLLPPRQLQNKEELLGFIRHVGCIQFDPINKVGRMPDLVLQARVQDYQPELLADLLYSERRLKDGWDKVASIYPVEDYPFFTRHRLEMVRQWGDPSAEMMKLAPMILEELRQRGPLSSIDIEHDERRQWWWGGSTRLVRATLDILDTMRLVGVHHRVATRRVFDLIERLLPEEILTTPDPFATMEDYTDWHVLRRIGGLGLSPVAGGEYWGGILKTKTPERTAALHRLVDKGLILPAAVEGVDGKTFFLRTSDLPEVEQAQNSPQTPPQMAFLAPLDNLLWQRDLLRWIFGFDYVWEVYKRPEDRKYGHYVLPVLYGERFVARVEPALDRKKKLFAVKNLWWEEGIQPDAQMNAALDTCLRSFKAYLGVP